MKEITGLILTTAHHPADARLTRHVDILNRNGISTNTEVLDAETLRTAALSNHNNARYDAALARLRLARAVGVL